MSENNAYLRHKQTVGEVTVDHATAILAIGTRAALHQLAGEDPKMRLITLGAFLFHLCQVDPERRDAMRKLLDAVADEVCQ